MLQNAMFPVTEVPAVGIPEKGKEIDGVCYPIASYELHILKGDKVLQHTQCPPIYRG